MTGRLLRSTVEDLNMATMRVVDMVRELEALIDYYRPGSKRGE